ncbi:MAG: amino acid ABC transporter substrate-binding protein, partial [Eggerthellaceae bacterium]|nr:amino acid ABC transporter substrate-binding protein [Eggerthellaceae bacterium]
SSTATETNTNTNATTNENANTNTASSTLGDDFTLIVGLDNSYPPYGFIGDDGELTGFDIDLATEVAERNGWNLDLEAIDWDTKDALLNQGTINAIWNGFTMEGREDSYTFSEPYMLNEQVIVVKSDSGITSWDDLAGLTVMTQVDSAALDLLEDEDGQKDLADTFGSLEQISDYNNAFMQLDSGMVDAVACDLSIAEYQMAANPDEYVMLDPLNSEHYAVGVQKGTTELADAISETLLEMYNDGTIAELCEKWSDYGITIDNWVLTS